MSQDPNNEQIDSKPIGPDLEDGGEEPEPLPEGEPLTELGEMAFVEMEGDTSPKDEAEAEVVVEPDEPVEQAPVGPDAAAVEADGLPGADETVEGDTGAEEKIKSTAGDVGQVRGRGPAGRSFLVEFLTTLGRALAATPVFAWLLGISVLAITLGALLLFLELKRYNFEINPTRVESSVPLRD